MKRLQTVTASALLAAALALSACSTPMRAGTSTALTQLSGGNEVPATTSAGTGSVETSFNKDTYLLRWTVTYSGLSGPATGGHFHGPAIPGQNAPVVVPFNGSLASPIMGEMILKPAQAADLLAGKWYVNLHTAANPGGEIRGQVVMGQ